MKKQGQIDICIKCGRSMKISARGLCNTCYDKDVKTRKIRVCSKCGEMKPHHSDGLCYRCAKMRDYYKNHEESKEKNRTYYNNNREKMIAKDRARNKTDKRKAWQQKHNQEQYTKNRSELLEYQKRYRAEHPGFITHHIQKRKARAAKLPNDLTKEQWEEILERYNHRCAYCGASGVPLQREHKTPVVRGGGYTASNIVPACRTCNQRKHTMTEDEFRAYLKKYPRE